MKGSFSFLVVGLVGGLTAVVLLTAILLPDMEGARERLLQSGYQPCGVRFEDPRFDGDGLWIRRVEMFEREMERHEIRTEERLHRIVVGPPRERSATGPFVVRLLTSIGLEPEGARVAISPEGNEIAFTHSGGWLWRKASGCWEGCALPEVLRSLNESERRALEERLVHPDRVVWTDAAIEHLLEEGVQGKPFADALLRARGDAELLLRLLLDSGDSEEMIRVLLGRNDDGLLQLRLLSALGSEALERVCRSSWPRPSVYLRNWLIGTLEDGSFESLRDRQPAFDRMVECIGAPFAERLRTIVRERYGASCVAAYLLLRRQPIGSLPDPSLEGEAKRWLR